MPRTCGSWSLRDCQLVRLREIHLVDYQATSLLGAEVKPFDVAILKIAAGLISGE
jgi:hypothetical protein